MGGWIWWRFLGPGSSLMASGKPLFLWLVDDSPSDAQLISLWLNQSPAVRQIEVMKTGETALHALRDRNDGEVPDLLLLDVNLPGLSGFEILSKIRDEPRWSQLPVLMLTGSTEPSDRERAQTLQARGCLTKPADAEGFGKLVKEIEGYWEELAR